VVNTRLDEEMEGGVVALKQGVVALETGFVVVGPHLEEDMHGARGSVRKGWCCVSNGRFVVGTHISGLVAREEATPREALPRPVLKEGVFAFETGVFELEKDVFVSETGVFALEMGGLPRRFSRTDWFIQPPNTGLGGTTRAPRGG